MLSSRFRPTEKKKLGIHAILFQAIQNNAELLSNSQLSSRRNIDQILTSLKPGSLSQETSTFCGQSVSQLANEISVERGSGILSHVNDILNTWRASWDAQYALETDQYRRWFFSGDPLRFWWLAKLYLVLYACRSTITEESEFFPFFRKPVADNGERIQLQARILTWLTRFRKGVNMHLPLGSSYLSQVMD